MVKSYGVYTLQFKNTSRKRERIYCKTCHFIQNHSQYTISHYLHEENLFCILRSAIPLLKIFLKICSKQ